MANRLALALHLQWIQKWCLGNWTFNLDFEDILLTPMNTVGNKLYYMDWSRIQVSLFWMWHLRLILIYYSKCNNCTTWHCGKHIDMEKSPWFIEYQTIWNWQMHCQVTYKHFSSIYLIFLCYRLFFINLVLQIFSHLNGAQVTELFKFSIWFRGVYRTSRRTTVIETRVVGKTQGIFQIPKTHQVSRNIKNKIEKENLFFNQTSVKNLK